MDAELPVAKKSRIVYESSGNSSGNPSINILPDELLMEILSYMSISELGDTIPRVCSRWDTVSRDAQLWRNKVYEVGNIERDEDVVRTLERVPQLRALVVHKRVGPSVLQALCVNCRELTSLDLDEYQKLSDSEMRYIVKTCKKLHTLKFPFSEGTLDVLIDGPQKLTHLCVLQLKWHLFLNVEVPLYLLADRYPQLCDLDLGYNHFQIQDLEYFLNAKRNTLKRIGVRWRSLSGSLVAPLLVVCAGTLEHLELYKCDNIHEGEVEAYAALRKLHNLQGLKFREADGDSDEGLTLLFTSGGLSSLTKLEFKDCHCEMVDTIIAVSRGCPALRELTLDCCGDLTDAAFVDIHHLQQLEILTIRYGTRLGGDVIPCIARLPALHTLRLNFMNFEELEAQHILDVSGLRCLDLSDCDIRPIPFDRFPGRLVNLRELHVNCCQGDQHILDEMCLHMPELKVYGELKS